MLLAWLVRETRIRVPQAGRWLRPRLTRLSAAIVAGLLLCSSYPRFNWWWAAVIAFAVLAWVLTRPATTPVGGFGYGFLFGLAFYLPLIRWISILVGAMPLVALVLLCAVFPGLFGLAAVAVRRLPGWPIWFAVLWAAQEWLKSTIPFGGFPWGVVAAGQTAGPFLPLVRLGGVPLLSLAIVLTGCSAAAFAMETVSWWQASRRRHAGADAAAADAPPAVVLPAFCICLVFFVAAAVSPQVRHSGTGSGNEPVVTAAVVQGNVPRLGLEFNAQRLAVLGNDVRETRSWPTTCVPVAHRNPTSSSGPRTRRRSTRYSIRTQRRRFRWPSRRSERRSWSARCSTSPAGRATRRLKPTPSSSGIPRQDPVTATTSGSCSHSANTCPGAGSSGI